MPDDTTNLPAPAPAPDDATRALAELPTQQQLLAVALAEGLRWRDAAARAGLTPGAAYRLYRVDSPLRRAVDALQAQHLPLADARLDVLTKAMVSALHPTADSRDLAVGLSAAQQVGLGLGIRRSLASPPPPPPAPAQTTVVVQIAVTGGASASLADAHPPSPLDVPTLDLDVGTVVPTPVEATQPVRSRASSRRAPKPR